jgi:hypothetical protein
MAKAAAAIKAYARQKLSLQLDLHRGTASYVLPWKSSSPMSLLKYGKYMTWLGTWFWTQTIWNNLLWNIEVLSRTVLQVATCILSSRYERGADQREGIERVQQGMSKTIKGQNGTNK